MLKVKVTPSAIHDIQNGIRYYNGKQKGLGRKFENKVNITFEKIKKTPESGSFIFEDIRYKVVERFPYIIVYALDNVNINVLRVFNTYQSVQNI